MRSSSPLLMLCGSQIIPPLAPPNGIFTTAHFLQGHIRREADSALARPARHGVLHAEAREYIDRAVVAGHRKMHDHFPRRRAQHLPQSFIEIQLARGKVEARALRLPWIDLLIQSDAA